MGAVATLIVVLGLLTWLFPFSLGTFMPIGGDVTQFFLGLMAFYADSLADGRLPAWNDLWGYGFPGVAESQMGTFYPPHLLLYGGLAVERAYVASLILHTLWAGLGASWCARTFGVGRLGAALSGFAFAASGFFVIHMPHPWGYTTGAWMPWAWGLAWSLLNHPDRPSAGRLFLLAAVLTLQVLPGHFQIAFMTLATIGALAGWTLLEGVAAKAGRASVGRFAKVAIGLAVALPLAAMQVWPTARLAGLAADRRDFEYLSGFAATPFHLVSLVAPGLFHRSPLWRPLVWDPFHTSPEEYLAYVGLAPLFLALMAVAREARRDAAVRGLTFLAIISLILSLGPYAPGFRGLIELPGFSFFRAPARWGLPMSLALAILAGVGVDRWPAWRRPARGLLGLAAASLLWIAAIVGLVELALASTAPSAGRDAADGFARAFRALPWEGDPDFRAVASLARRPTPGLGSFESSRFAIYRDELAGTLALLAGLAAVAALAAASRTRRFAPAALVALTGADLLLLGRHRPVESAPLRPLVEQSPVLARLAREPRGTRTIDPMRNLPMAVGLAPVQAYRTLDLPALPPLAALARGPLGPGPEGDLARRAMRATGAGLRVLDPTESAMPVPEDWPVETVVDPDLARWIFGPAWNPKHLREADTFRIARVPGTASRAWLSESPAPEAGGGDPRVVLDWIDAARPLEDRSSSPGVCEIPLAAVERPGTVLVSMLYDPQWRAEFRDGGRSTVANIRPAFGVGKGGGAWMQVEVRTPPGPAAVLRLTYDAADVRRGLWISGACWAGWCAAILEAARRARRSVPRSPG